MDISNRHQAINTLYSVYTFSFDRLLIYDNYLRFPYIYSSNIWISSVNNVNEDDENNYPRGYRVIMNGIKFDI